MPSGYNSSPLETSRNTYGRKLMNFRKTLFGGLLAMLLVFTSVEIGEGRLNRNSAGVDVTSRPSHIPMILHQRHGRNATSTNWGGYAVTGTSGSVSDVKASWI